MKKRTKRLGISGLVLLSALGAGIVGNNLNDADSLKSQMEHMNPEGQELYASYIEEKYQAMNAFQKLGNIARYSIAKDYLKK